MKRTVSIIAVSMSLFGTAQAQTFDMVCNGTFTRPLERQNGVLLLIDEDKVIVQGSRQFQGEYRITKVDEASYQFEHRGKKGYLNRFSAQLVMEQGSNKFEGNCFRQERRF